MIKRFGWFILTNFLVVTSIGVLIKLFGVDSYLSDNGIDYVALLIFSAILGFGGSLISLFLSKTLATLSTGAEIIRSPRSEDEAWLLETVESLAKKANVTMPAVAVYHGSANAFATGAFKNDALIAVSTGLMRSMTRPQIQAVLAHEMSHIVNGDMVTMTLIQGVLNTFVFFFARIAALVLQSRENTSQRRSRMGMSYYLTVQAFELVFGILASVASCAFSRRREFAADAGAARLLGAPDKMIEALKVLGGTDITPLPQEMKAFGIVGLPSFSELFSTHPSIKNRIKSLSLLTNFSPAGRGGLFKNV